MQTVPQQTWVDQVFLFFVKKREQVITLFKILYVCIVVLFFIGSRSIYLQDDQFVFFYMLGKNLGQTALIAYILTTIPGIAGRFGIKHKLISILKIFRRYLGITMYLLVMTHYTWLRGIDIWIRGNFTFPPILFEAMGMSAFFLLTPMVLTSNDWAVKKLGIWWWRIHKVTYIIIGLIFLHTALQRWSFWSIAIGIMFAVQIISFIYQRLRAKIIKNPEVSS